MKFRCPRWLSHEKEKGDVQNIDPHVVVRTEEQEHPACPDGNEDFVKITVF